MLRNGKKPAKVSIQSLSKFLAGLFLRNEYADFKIYMEIQRI